MLALLKRNPNTVEFVGAGVVADGVSSVTIITPEKTLTLPTVGGVFKVSAEHDVRSEGGLTRFIANG